MFDNQAWFITQFRESQKLMQVELADKLGTSQQQLSNIEKRRQGIPFEMAVKLVNLGANANKLFRCVMLDYRNKWLGLLK